MEEGHLAKSVYLTIFRGTCQGRLAPGGDTSGDTRKIIVGDSGKNSSVSGVIIPLENLVKIVSL